MNKASFLLDKTQENLLNVEMLRAEKEMNNINAIIELPERLSSQEVTDILNGMLENLEFLRIEILPTKMQYIAEYTPLNLLEVKSAETVREYNQLINEWKSQSIFSFQMPLYQFILVETDTQGKQLLIKLHHLISDIHTITEFVETFISLTLNEKKAGSTKYSISIEEEDDWEGSSDFWRHEVDGFEGKELYKTKDKLLKTREMMLDFPKTLLKKFQNSDLSSQMTIYELFLAGTVYAKKIMTMSSHASIGIAAGRLGKQHFGSKTKVLPLMSRVKDATTVRDFLTEIKRKRREIELHGDYTVSQIIEEFGEIAIDSHTDISCVEIDQTISESHQKKGFLFTLINNGSKSNPLTIKCHTYKKQPFFTYEYQKNTLSSKEIRRFHSFIMHLLFEFIAKSEEKLHSVSLIQKSRLLKIRSGQKLEETVSQNILDVFNEQVEKYPQKTAVCFKEETLTFKQLDEKSSTVAALLSSKGIQSSQVVATMLTGTNAIIAILGILKVGAVYLPIDMNLPEERVDYILKDSSCRLVITETSENNNQKKIQIDSLLLNQIDFSQKKHYEVQKIETDHVAYMIYTSGSTGAPKGVMVKHRGVVNMCIAFADTIGINETDVIQQFASHSFDASILEVFGGLLNGSSVVMVDPETKQDPVKLQNLWDEQQVTFAIIPPVYMKNLDSKRPTTLKYLMTAGEAANWNFIQPWKDKVTYINAYGPSEATVWTTTWLYEECKTDQPVPIGVPIRNVKCYVFQGEQECGPQMPGELCIAGESLGAGYVNNSEKNQTSFREHPDTGEKMYCTGDIVYWSEEGQLIFCGRNDAQVKVRGHRVELGEINGALLNIEGVVESYVCLNEENTEDKELIAYISLESEIDYQNVCNQIKAGLPSYMHPHHVIQVASLPMTLNGKVDRKELPKLVRNYKTSITNQLKDSVESAVVAAYEQILKTTITENSYDFYSLGGDSIKAIRIVSKLRNLGYKVESKDLIESTSISEIAQKIKGSEESVNSLKQEVKTAPLRLSPIQQEFFRKDFLVKDHFNQCLTLFTEAHLSVERAKSLIQSFAERHQQFQMNYDVHNQPFINADRELFLFESHDLKEVSEVEFNSEFTKICQKNQEKFEIDSTPLMNVVLFDTTKGSYLFIAVHHLIIDGVSWRVLTDELEMIYEGTMTDKVNGYEEASTFQDWLLELEDYHSRQVVTEEKYWENINSSMGQLLRNKKTSVSSDTSVEHMVLSKEVSQKMLNGVCARLDYSITDVFVAALSSALEEEQVGIVLESHGRESISNTVQNDSIIGWFTTYYPMVFSKTGDIKQMLSTVSRKIKEVPNKGLNYLTFKNQKHKKNQPVFEPQIIFNYLGDFQEQERQFKIEHLDTGQRNSAANPLWFPMTITGKCVDEEIVFEFYFDREQFSEEYVKEVIARFVKAIESIVTLCETNTVSESYGEEMWEADEIDQAVVQAKEQQLEIEKIYPLSPMQENFLFNKMYQAEDNYVVQVVMNVREGLCEDRIRKAVDKLSSYYEVLRTAIYYKKQSVARNVQFKNRKIPFTFKDLSYFGGDEVEQYISDYLQYERSEQWDFETDSLFRVHVVKDAADSTKLIWSFHHILMDGWCLDIINKAFIQLYKETDISGIKEISSEYSDYISHIQTANLEEQLTFWKEYLSKFESQPLMIPERANFNENNSKPMDFTMTDIQLSQQLSEKIKALGQRIKVSVGTIMESAWGLVLQGYSMSDDVVFGKVVSGRNHPIPNIDKLLGLFINTIPVRVRGNQELTVKQLLRYQQKATLQTEHYQLVSLSDVNKLMDGKIETLFSYDVFNDSRSDLMEHQQTIEQTNYALNMSVIQKEDIELRMMFDSSKYSETTMLAVLKRYEFVLEQFVENENLPLKSLEYAWLEESKILLNEYGQNAHPDILTGRNIVAEFQEKVKRWPDKTAVICRDHQLTYHELDRKSSDIAQYLKQQGVHPGDYVLSLQERGIEAVASLLGILKAQGIYIPVDFKVPKERLSYILEDSKARHLFTTKHLAQQYSDVLEKRNLSKIYVENIAMLTDLNEWSVPAFSEEEPAYIIYTSGSTGNPKGVIIKHKSAVNMALGMHREFGFDEAEEVLQQFASLAFDASILEILTAVLNGHTLVVVPEEIKLNPELVVELMNKEKVTWGVLPPVFVNEINPNTVLTLKYLKTAGEESNWEMVKKWQDKLSYANGYGPTEATVWATTWFAKKEEQNYRSVPIGRPAPNVSCYILQKNKLCGIGMIGELCIAGVGVGKSYLNRDQLTKEKFSIYRDKKIYRTGDYARWSEDGVLEFLGRKDNQVKIRGNRIELGEIESKIKEITDIKEAVVLVKEQGQEKELYSYIVSEHLIAKETIRTYISDTLPSYMVPTEIIQLEKIPVTANGKIDKKQLLAVKPVLNNPIAQENEQETAVYPPIYKKIQMIFNEVLGERQIGIEENFFDIGGHSVKAARLVNRINKIFEIQLGLNQFFDRPTVSYVAEYILNNTAEKIKARELPVNKLEFIDPEVKKFPATSTQKRLFALQMIYPKATTYNMPSLFKFNQEICEQQLQQAFEKVVRYFEMLRVNFKLSESTLFIQMTEQLNELEVSECRESELKDYFNTCIRPFDLENESLIRLKVIRTEKAEYLFVDIHHAVCDGHSTTMFMQALMNVYQGRPLNPIPISVAELNNLINQEDNKKAEAYWKEILKEEPTALELPLDYPRVARSEAVGSELTETMKPALRKKVLRYCADNNLTLYMFFVTITMFYLHQKTAQTDIIIGTPINSRVYDGSEDVFGMYANSLPLRGNISKDKSFLEVSKEMKELVLSVFENQSYPLEKILKIHNSNNDYTRNPLFDVFLAFNQYETGSEENQPFLEKIAMETRTAPFDLTIDILDVDQELTIRWEYKDALFEEQTIQKMMSEYSVLIEQTIGAQVTNLIQPDKTRGIIQAVLNREPNFSESFLGQGGDSIKAIRLSSKLKEYGLEIPSNDILSCNKLSDLFVEESSMNNQRLIQIIESELNVIEFDTEKGFLAQGGDSIKAIRVASKLREVGIEIEADELLQAKSLNSLLTKQHAPKAKDDIQTLATKDDTLISPIIETFFEQEMANPHFFNQAVLLELDQSDSYEQIIHIFDEITAHHSIFGENFLTNVGSENRFLKVDRTIYDSYFYELGESGIDQEIKGVCEELQSQFNIEQTALLKLVYFKSKKRTFLFICAHHLVIDGVSWRILLDDFLVLKNQLKLGQQLKLPYQTLSYRQWLKALKELKEHGNKESVHSEINYWENIETEIKEGKLISLRQNKSGITSSFKNQPLLLDAELTGKLLEQCNAEQDIQINDLLLTALSFAMDKTTGQKKLAINLEGHGRESMDQNIRIDRTIGWFTTIYPVVLNCKASNIQELLSKTRLNLRRIPQKGFNYGVLKYCSEKLVPKSVADCSFNFMGNMDVHSNELTMSRYDIGRTMAEENNLWSPLNFNGVIQNNCLRFDIDFNQTYFSQDFIERLIQSFKTALYLLSGSDFDGQEKQIFPLTPAQEGLLFQKLSDENSEAYSTQTMFEIVGESPDIDRLKEAISCLAIKHHALSFKVVKDESQEYGQCLEESQLIEVKEYDYSRSSQAVEEVLTMVSSSEVNREFLLEEGNLFRVSIVLAPEERAFLLFNFHHIVFDGWSLSNLLLTLSELYQFNMNRQFQSSEEYLAESDKYEEFLTYIKAQDDGEKKVYWTKLLEGYDSPSDFKLLETEVQTEKTHESERLTVSPHLYESLSQMSIQSSVTKNTIMEVVWGLLLQKYNYTNDAVFGKVVSGRNYPVNRISEIVGMLINTIPIRICSKEDENISELIQQTQQQSFDSQDFHGSSLASIQQWLNKDTPLISTIYSYSSFVVENQLFPLSEKTDLKIHGGLEKVNYDIACSVYDNSDSMSIQLTYNPQKFESSTIKNILSTMENILEFLCVYPTAKVSEIQVLNQEQLTDLYFNSEAESVEVSMDTIPKEITKRAIENPEKTAIHFSDQRITFRELDERTNAVANALLSKGIKLEDRVGIFLPKTPFTIIAMLGVMKAGACCVTMDSTTPLERVAYQMQKQPFSFLIKLFCQLVLR